jgi:hypothetical protein
MTKTVRYLFAGVFLLWAGSAQAQTPTAFDQLKALQGEWLDLEGVVGPKGAVLVTYRVTGGGTAVVETMFPGAPHEMTTVYHRDGKDLVLTHYCSGGTQPRMRATAPGGKVLIFDFDGGTNFNPATDSHMHNARIEFVSANEIRAEWQGWEKGKPAGAHLAKMHLARKTR